MGEMIDKRKYEELESDFNKILSKGEWKPEDLCKMKDIQKILYYIDVRQAMKEGADYPGEQYMPEAMSYARGRNMNNGRYMSRDMGRGSGTYYPPYMDGQNQWDGMNTPGRNYYDSQKEKYLHKIHNMMDNTDDAERKAALNFAIKVIESHNQPI